MIVAEASASAECDEFRRCQGAHHLNIACPKDPDTSSLVQHVVREVTAIEQVWGDVTILLVISYSAL